MPMYLKAPFYKEKTSKTPNGSPSNTSSTEHNDSFPGKMNTQRL